LDSIPELLKSTLSEEERTDVWITIIYCKWFEKYFMDKKNNWKLIQKKSISWVKKYKEKGLNYEELALLAENAI